MHPNLPIETFLKLTSNLPTLVFGGFSGLGYENQAELEQHLRKLLTEFSPTSPLRVVVCGATPEGIGCVYPIAKELGYLTLGLVAPSTDYEVTFSPACELVCALPQVNKSWDTLDPKTGLSYMVTCATPNSKREARLHYLGGGETSIRELNTARKLGVPYIVEPQWNPSSVAVAKKLSKNPAFSAELESYLIHLSDLQGSK